MVSKYLIIGDIHGDVGSLRAILSNAGDDRLPIFLGDYINYGNESKEVVDYLISYRKLNQTIFLLGNHEYYLHQYLDNEISFHDFASIGGIPTIKSYLGNGLSGDIRDLLIENIPQSHLSFFASLEIYFEEENFFCSHSGLNFKCPTSRKKEDLIMNTELELQRGVIDKRIICGHFIQEGYDPYFSDDLICIDTGCGSRNGPLTALLIPEYRIIQSA